MPPRRYRLGRRAESAEETRRRIVAATYALHNEQGIAATTMKQIAERAGVSIGSVYHHFPTYEDTVRACGQHIIETIPPPSAAIFTGLATTAARVERLAAEIFGYYERIPVFERARCDQDTVPLLRDFVAEEERRRRDLVAEALDASDPEDPRVGTVAALLDMAVYRALVRDGLGAPAAAARIAEIINAWLSADRPRPRRRGA